MTPRLLFPPIIATILLLRSACPTTSSALPAATTTTSATNTPKPATTTTTTTTTTTIITTTATTTITTTTTTTLASTVAVSDCYYHRTGRYKLRPPILQPSCRTPIMQSGDFGELQGYTAVTFASDCKSATITFSAYFACRGGTSSGVEYSFNGGAYSSVITASVSSSFTALCFLWDLPTINTAQTLNGQNGAIVELFSNPEHLTSDVWLDSNTMNCQTVRGSGRINVMLRPPSWLGAPPSPLSWDPKTVPLVHRFTRVATFPHCAVWTTHFHCERTLSSCTDPVQLNAGWLVGLTDLNTELDYVLERIATNMESLFSVGFSGFRIDAAKRYLGSAVRALFVIQNADHDQQNSGSSSRHMGVTGSVLIKDKDVAKHRSFEVKLFTRTDGNWQIRNFLPGLSLSLQLVQLRSRTANPHAPTTRAVRRAAWTCPIALPFLSNSCGYSVQSSSGWFYELNECLMVYGEYRRVHRDLSIFIAMRGWMGLASVTATKIHNVLKITGDRIRQEEEWMPVWEVPKENRDLIHIRIAWILQKKVGISYMMYSRTVASTIASMERTNGDHLPIRKLISFKLIEWVSVKSRVVQRKASSWIHTLWSVPGAEQVPLLVHASSSIQKLIRTERRRVVQNKLIFTSRLIVFTKHTFFRDPEHPGHGEEVQGAMAVPIKRLNLCNNRLRDEWCCILMDALGGEIGFIDTGGRVVVQTLNHTGELVLVDLRNNGIDPALYEIDNRLVRNSVSQGLWDTSSSPFQRIFRDVDPELLWLSPNDPPQKRARLPVRIKPAPPTERKNATYRKVKVKSRDEPSPKKKKWFSNGHNFTFHFDYVVITHRIGKGWSKRPSRIPTEIRAQPSAPPQSAFVDDLKMKGFHAFLDQLEVERARDRANQEQRRRELAELKQGLLVSVGRRKIAQSHPKGERSRHKHTNYGETKRNEAVERQNQPRESDFAIVVGRACGSSKGTWNKRAASVGPETLTRAEANVETSDQEYSNEYEEVDEVYDDDGAEYCEDDGADNDEPIAPNCNQ
ncbi:hypothetical protein BJ742DRAFT_739352 [Cladochytrium replicatum]|nr:hypothetical protein BJ742DRAFT_739352 [Cladochytrium replicatum]